MTLTAEQVSEAGLADWRLVDQTLRAGFATGKFRIGLELVNRIGAEAEAAHHHPDIELTYSRVNLLLTTHDAGGLTERDLEMARTISRVAAELGVAADAVSDD